MGDINENFINYLNTIVGKENDKIITQELLSKMTGCTFVSMSRYLSMQRKMPADILFKIKKVLNIDDETFMSFYQEYSTQNNSIIKRYNNLSDEGKKTLYDYLNYIEFSEQQKKDKKLSKTLKLN